MKILPSRVQFIKHVHRKDGYGPLSFECKGNDFNLAIEHLNFPYSIFQFASIRQCLEDYALIICALML